MPRELRAGDPLQVSAARGLALRQARVAQLHALATVRALHVRLHVSG